MEDEIIFFSKFLQSNLQKLIFWFQIFLLRICYQKNNTKYSSVPFSTHIAICFIYLCLADSLFFRVFFTIFKSDNIKSKVNLSFANNSKLGWIIIHTTFFYIVNNIQLSTNKLGENFRHFFQFLKLRTVRSV